MHFDSQHGGLALEVVRPDTSCEMRLIPGDGAILDFPADKPQRKGQLMHRSMFTRFTAILILAGAGLVGLTAVSSANPPNIPDGWHKVFQFNLIGFPGKDYTGGCGQGNRVFVNRDAHGATMLVTNGTSWDITDCNATGDHRASMTTVDVAKYAVFVRILGKPEGTLHICADSFEDFTAGETLCLLGTIDLTRGKGQSLSLIHI